MDALALSRIQFGITIGFHYLFPVTTLGLTLCILIFESLYMVRRGDQWRRFSELLVKLLAPVFVMGVATGLGMPFAFGTNWSEFSRVSGEIFGSFLAIEGMTAFIIESVFLGILLFGRDRVSRNVYYASAVIVFAGAHLSAFWIVVANSWMQTPAGYMHSGDRLVVTSLNLAILNPTTLLRFCHVVAGAWITGAVLSCAIAARFVLRNASSTGALGMLRVSVILLAVLPLVELELGHEHIVQTAEYQPAKAAAFEGMFKTAKSAPEFLFGIPDAHRKTIRLGLGIPGLLSFLSTSHWDAEVNGLDKFPETEWPPVEVVFSTFHLMVAVGIILIAVGIAGAALLAAKKLAASRWYLLLLVACVPLPYISNEMGWIGAEMGRQPWAIYGVLKTSQSVSPLVTSGQVVLSLVMMCVVYAGLFAAFLFAVRRVLQKNDLMQTEGQK